MVSHVVALPSGAQDNFSNGPQGDAFDTAPVPDMNRVPQNLPFSTAPYYRMYYGQQPGGHVSVPSVYGRGTSRASYYIPGYSNPGAAQTPQQYPNSTVLPQSQPPMMPAGMILPCTTMTTISEKAAKDGDPVRAVVSRNIKLQAAGYFIPAGTLLTGTLRGYENGHWINKESYLSIVFDQMRFPDGRTFPIRAHLTNGYSGYGPAGDPNSDAARESRYTQLGLHNASANLMDVGMTLPLSPGNVRGLFSGTTIDNGIMTLGRLFLNPNHTPNVVVPSGSTVQIELEQNVSLATSSPATDSTAAASP
jgi:hypothetical protein